MKKVVKRYLLHIGISLGLSAATFCLVFFLRHQFTMTGWCDALFVAATVSIAAGGLVACTRSGAFDVLRYGMMRLIDQFRHHDEKKYENAGDYGLAMQKKRLNSPVPFWVYFIVGGLLLIPSVILACLV